MKLPHNTRYKTMLLAEAVPFLHIKFDDFNVTLKGEMTWSKATVFYQHPVTRKVQQDVDLYDPRNMHLAWLVLQWGYTNIPGFRAWFEYGSNSVRVLLYAGGFDLALNRLIQFITVLKMRRRHEQQEKEETDERKREE